MTVALQRHVWSSIIHFQWATAALNLFTHIIWSSCGFCWVYPFYIRGEKGPFATKTSRWKMYVGNRPILWVTITDAIGWALIKHKRLNQWSPSGLLLKWSINPSPSLKCMMTDSGKLLSAGLFAHLLPTSLPNLPCGKALIRKVRCLISSDCQHNYVLQRAKQCLGTNCERCGKAAFKCSNYFPNGSRCQEQILIKHSKHYLVDCFRRHAKPGFLVFPPICFLFCYSNVSQFNSIFF